LTGDEVAVGKLDDAWIAGVDDDVCVTIVVVNFEIVDFEDADMDVLVDE
jgi:hypothetical protein